MLSGMRRESATPRACSSLLAETIRRAIDAHAQRCKKCSILDLDDTLWGGIVGETGPLGVHLSEDGKGRCYRDFQRCIKAATRTGVLLAIASKNNEADVMEVFDRNKMMVLRREDFSAMPSTGPEGGRTSSTLPMQLNLGTDSFVFIDDNPAERDAVKMAVPDVTVPDFPPREPKNLRLGSCKRSCRPISASTQSPTKTQQKPNSTAPTRRVEQLAAGFDLDEYLLN